MPSISEIIAAKKAAREAAQAEAEKLPSTTKSTIDGSDPDNALIMDAIRIFGAEIEENPPEIATPFGPRVAEGDDHSV